MTGVGCGVCKSTCPATPRSRGPFQQATSRPRLSQLRTGLLLTEQPLGKIHPLSQLRHFLAHLLQLAQDLLTLGGLHARPAMFAGDALRDRGSDGSKNPEGAAEEHEGRNSFRPVHVCDFFASSRSVKSMRSPRSPISRRACWISASRSSRRICSSSRRPASTARGRMRSARARTSGNSSTDDPMIVSTKRKTTSSGTGLPRRREPLGFPLFRDQPLEEIDALPQLTHLFADMAHFFDLPPQLLDLVRRLIVVTADRLAAEKPGCQGFADGGNREEKECPAPEQQNDRNEPDQIIRIHRVSSLPRPTYGLVSRLQHLAQELPRMRALGLGDFLG